MKWKTNCKSKSKGGPGVRDIRFVNMSLLAKWRLLDGENLLWKEVLVGKYGSDISKMEVRGNVTYGQLLPLDSGRIFGW